MKNTIDVTVYNLLFHYFAQPGSKRAGVGTEDKFPCKETKAATLDPLSCISKEPELLITMCCKFFFLYTCCFKNS